MYRTFSAGSFILGLALALTGGFATDASAACPTPPANGGPFFIDGIVGDTGGNVCNNSGLAPGASKTTDPNGNAKELGPVNASGTKLSVINSAGKPMLDFTNPNGQTDLNTIYTQSGIAGTDLWFYFGWRRDANSGSGFISIELDRAAAAVGCNYSAAGIDMVQPQSAAETTLINNCNPWSSRSGDGTTSNSDLLILWDQSGGSKDLFVRYYNSALASWGPAFAIPAAVAVAQYSADGFSGEAAINLTGVVGNTTSCITFANLIPGTVTGNSDTADYKDTVLSAFPSASNCGELRVRKVTRDPDGVAFAGTGTFRYTFDRSGGADIRYSAGTVSSPDVETLKLSTRTFTAGNMGACTSSTCATFGSLIAGTDYRIAEDVTAEVLGDDWTFVGISCVVDGTTFPDPATSANPKTGITLVASKTTWCTITNQRAKESPAGSTVPSAKVYLFDSIAISGIAPTTSPAQSVTFGLFTNSTCTTQVGSNVSASLSYNAAGTDASASTLPNDGIQVLSLSGNTYYWKVTYPGDLLNNAFTTCGTGAVGTLESTTVTVSHVQ